jgi:hypothetical protein
MTICWATVCAMSRPRSSSTSASERSIPAVTPADVQTLPSRMKIGSQSGGHDLADVTAAEPRRMAEHLVRADHVERLEAIEDDEDGPALFHAFTLLPAGQWRQRHVPHVSRHRVTSQRSAATARWVKIATPAPVPSPGHQLMTATGNGRVAV